MFVMDLDHLLVALPVIVAIFMAISYSAGGWTGRTIVLLIFAFSSLFAADSAAREIWGRGTYIFIIAFAALLAFAVMILLMRIWSVVTMFCAVWSGTFLLMFFLPPFMSDERMSYRMLLREQWSDSSNLRAMAAISCIVAMILTGWLFSRRTRDAQRS